MAGCCGVLVALLIVGGIIGLNGFGRGLGIIAGLIVLFWVGVIVFTKLEDWFNK